MLLANVCAGFFCSCCGEFGFQLFLGFVEAPWGAVCMGDTSSAGFSLILTGFGLRRSVVRWSRFFGGVRRGHSLRDSRGVFWITQKSVVVFGWEYCFFGYFMLYMLALVGLPSLRGCDACMVFGSKEASRRSCRHKYNKTSFSPLMFFC